MRVGYDNGRKIRVMNNLKTEILNLRFIGAPFLEYVFIADFVLWYQPFLFQETFIFYKAGKDSTFKKAF